MDNLPSPAWNERVLTLVQEHLFLAEPIAFALCFAESIVFVSLFVPSTVLLLALGALHGAAGGGFWTLWLAAAAGAFAGDAVTYAAGRNFDSRIAGLWPLSRNPHWYARAAAFVEGWGMLGIVASKFLGMLRPFVPVLAGALKMGWPRFLAASAISALLWAGAILGPGYGFVHLAR